MSRIYVTFALAAAVGCSQSKPETTQASAETKAAPTESAKPAPAAATAARKSPLPIGAAVVMADTKMKNVDDRMVSIGGVKGDKGTLVIFTCNHCPYVKAWEARITEAGNQARKMGFGVIAINSNDPAAFAEDTFEQMQVRAKKLGLQFPYVVDATSDVARAYGASKTPEVFLFDANDKLVYYGAVDDNYRDASKVEQNYLSDAVKAVAEGKPVAKTVTKALGCSIKFRS